MAHVRAQIRDAVAVLLAGNGATVIKTRTYPLNDPELPMFMVYTNTERSELDSIGSTAALMRELDIVIEIVASGAINTLDDTLDDFAAVVEAALADQTYSGLAKDTNLSSTETEISVEGNTPIGMIRLTFAVMYRTVTNDATTARA